MSAGVCGKRLGLEEFFGSSPAAKRSRCFYGSPISSPDFGFASDDKVSSLLRMFPSINREVVETILKSHDDKIDDAIKSLDALCLVDGSTMNGAGVLEPTFHLNDDNIEGMSGVLGAQTSEVKVEAASNNSLPHDRASWVEFFVQEMMNTSNWDEVRDRVSKILEAFERSVLEQPTSSEDAIHREQQEIASLKEQLVCLLRDNQILKKAVAIQHERNLENDERLKEVQQLKHIISQYEEQVRTLELHNYTLKVHLQRAQEDSSIPSRFHPDIF
ncbi:putative ubiquitin system component CUE, UBA-like superfamily [Dioscorea sansibarensis]